MFRRQFLFVGAFVGGWALLPAKIMMQNGRTLTTLILTDGQWLADTIWFK